MKNKTVCELHSCCNVNTYLLTMRRNIREAYSVDLMVSNFVFHLYGCTECLICLWEENLYLNISVVESTAFLFLSDQTGYIHTMGSTIKKTSLSYLQKEEAISGLNRDAPSLSYSNFFIHVLEPIRKSNIRVFSSPFLYCNCL